MRVRRPDPNRRAWLTDASRIQCRGALDALPDVRDGLNRLERAILYELGRAQRELGKADIPTPLLYGRVIEHVDVSQSEFQHALSRLAGRGDR